MRTTRRNETPNPKTYRHANYKSAAEKRVSDERVDLVSNPTLSGRDKALEALAKMKALEAKYKKKMRSVQVDSHTILCSNKRENLKRRVDEYSR